MARNWKKMSKEEEDKKRQETIDKAIETMNKGIYEYLDSDSRNAEKITGRIGARSSESCTTKTYWR